MDMGFTPQPFGHNCLGSQSPLSSTELPIWASRVAFSSMGLFRPLAGCRSLKTVSATIFTRLPLQAWPLAPDFLLWRGRAGGAWRLKEEAMDRQPSGLTFCARFFFPLGGMWLPHLNLIHFFCEMETRKTSRSRSCCGY